MQTKVKIEMAKASPAKVSNTLNALEKNLETNVPYAGVKVAVTAVLSGPSDALDTELANYASLQAKLKASSAKVKELTIDAKTAYGEAIAALEAEDNSDSALLSANLVLISTNRNLNLFPGEKNGFVLTIDSINWKYGRNHINILMIGVVFKGVAHPLVWKTLPVETKRGNSATAHRTELMEKLLRIIQPTDIKCLLVDREFIGND